jgi:hypothetical protein
MGPHPFSLEAVRGSSSFPFHTPYPAQHTAASGLSPRAEVEIVESLDRVVGLYPDVVFGSYPVITGDGHRVVITLESQDEGRLGEAREAFLGDVPGDLVLRVELDDRIVAT